MREKYCWLASGCKLVLERCERKTLLDWRLLELPNRVDEFGWALRHYVIYFASQNKGIFTDFTRTAFDHVQFDSSLQEHQGWLHICNRLAS